MKQLFTSVPAFWGTVALIILALDIIGVAIACIVLCSEGINWAVIGGAVAEVAFAALLCGTVYLLSSIDTSLKVIGSSLILKK